MSEAPANGLNQYLPLRDFDDVTNALNFDTVDCRIIGSCDLYTTKAAGGDKKLYKNIEHSLEAQYESLLRFSASLSPPQASSAAASLNLSRSSPFGSLSQISSRRTFAYLIATLNASHPDYDFSHILQPSDFRREKSLKSVINTLDTTLYNLRPRQSSSIPNGPPHWSSDISAVGPPTPGGSPLWNPRMWRVIDNEMSLKDCSIYSYSPEEDLYDIEEGAIWSFNYFFFNKARKRVCYIYLRGLSIISHSPYLRNPITMKRRAEEEWQTGVESGASKRARYWLGDRAMQDVTSSWDNDDDDDNDIVVSKAVGDRAEEPQLVNDSDRPEHPMSTDPPANPQRTRSRSKSTMRGISEDIADSMEV
ncbi:MAG: hypothetical protein Q9187_000815 [Circinaria calcarea]